MSGLNIGVLTTDTTHHRYFIRRLWAEAPSTVTLRFCLFESKAYPWRAKARRHFFNTLPNLYDGLMRNPYFRSGALARSQHRFEYERFFTDGDDSLPSGLTTRCVHSVNDANSREFLDDHPVDLLLVYGTGLVKPSVFSRPRLGSLNAHGGLLPGYRGLDTNLWAAYLGHPEDMSVTIHVVEEDFDTGAVVAHARLPRSSDLSVASMRFHSAVLATDLYLGVLEAIAETGEIRALSPTTGRPERYFGPMPTRLKRVADASIRAYVGQDWEQ